MPNSTSSSAWLARQEPCKASAPYRLIHFGWGGNRGGKGAEYSTAMWPRLLDHQFEVYNVVLPGRGTRMDEATRTDAQELVVEIAAVLEDALEGGKPYAFFGFAFGAVLAYEVALLLEQSQPELICTVSAEGPAWEGRREPPGGRLGELDERAFEAALREKRGSTEILDDPELKRLFLPTVRGDILLEESYEYMDDRIGTESSRIPVIAVYAKKCADDWEATLVSREAAWYWMEATQVASPPKSRVVELKAYDWYLLEGPDLSGAKAVLGEVLGFFRAKEAEAQGG